MEPTKIIWQNGNFKPWEEAKTHFLTHSLHYGTAVFEGIRAYETPKGTFIFRGLEHFERLLRSAHYYFYDVNYTAEELLEISKELLRQNELKAAYIRPLIYYGYGKMGLSPVGAPTDIGMAAWHWGAYLGEEGLEKGIRVKISKWARIDERILPPQSKCAANYANSTLAKMEALHAGYDEALLFNLDGHVAEGSVVNVFIVKDGVITTPPIGDNALDGLTRRSVMTIATDMGYTVNEASIRKETLLDADEMFFTGTAAELTPVKEVDTHQIGEGKRGPVTKAIQAEYTKATSGESETYAHWLTAV